MSQAGVKHDYHLVNPSPWPFVGSLAAVCMAFGAVIFMKGLFGLPKGNLVVLLMGLAGVPMMPVAKGPASARRQILIYSLLFAALLAEHLLGLHPLKALI